MAMGLLVCIVVLREVVSCLKTLPTHVVVLESLQHGHIRMPLFIGIGLMIIQQWSGINAVVCFLLHMAFRSIH